ncbi:maestro heat-like repeat-containing protein family member 1 isoform X7 [Trachemys scripta elegans]|uniref:maestro heat-like repeat-containing protein family member 1 isoform X7 n=1 Tax=Trachemys scripta elegans TaxID=31138 RepID=UPI001556BFB6|nr:maestro heat-like repeat-containing protein family member 1 isoform X7 [Trachemys scripta elegans]
MLCGQQRPQEPSPDSQQEASPCPVTEDLPASPGQEVEDPCPTTSSSARSPWDSSSAWDSGSSEADGRRSFVPGTARDSGDEEEEWVDVATEEAALNNSREQLQGGEKELIEELPDNSPPGAVLANSLIAVGNLSTMTPALEPELETHLLRAALHAVFTLGMEKDTTQVQDLPRVLPDLLDAMLGNLLAESPDTDRLQYILEHINYWIVSRVPRERARAVKSSTALLRFTITLPEFDVSDL